MIKLEEEGIKEFRLKKKINNLAWDSVKVSITRSFWNSYNIPAMYSVVYNAWNKPTFWLDFGQQ